MKRQKHIRQAMMPVLTLFVWTIAGCNRDAVTAEQDKKISDEGVIEFNSKLSLVVWEIDTELDTALEYQKPLGQTPSEVPIRISPRSRWGVTPSDQASTQATVAEIQAKSIPGLQLRQPSKDGDLVHLKELENLQTLDLRFTQVTNAGLMHLRELKNLQKLDLGGTRVTDAGLVHLRELKNLQELNLMSTQVTDADLVPLKELKNLQKLDLWRTEVTDAGLVHLRELKNLQELNLEGTQVTDEGKKKLRQALPNVKTMEPWGQAFPDLSRI